MEEGKKRKREIVLLSITIVLASAALIVQVLFGKEGLLRKNSESIRDVFIEEASKNRNADSIYVEGILLGFIRIRCLLVQLCLKRSSDFVLAAGCGSVFYSFLLVGY